MNPNPASVILQRVRSLLLATALIVFTTVSYRTALADNVDGAWSPLTDWPLISVHAALTPDGRVLTYGTNPDGRQTGYFVYDIWDPTAGLGAGHMTLDNMTMTDIFCSSHVILPQTGEVFIAGGDNWTGSSTTNTGNNNTNLFDFGDNSLARSTNMHRARWYSSSTVLLNGEVYIQGGSGGNDYPEVREADGGFRLLNTAPTNTYATLFPRNFLAPDGRVFGYDTNGKMFFVDPAGAGSIAAAGQFSSSYAGWQSSAAMFRPGKILQVAANSTGALVIDINGPTPEFTPTASLSSQRRWVNATVMADGKVLATGGSRVDNQLTDVNNFAEIWDPDTGTWHVGAEAVRARLYHSAGLLLPDASVLVSGGGAPGPYINTNAEIYYPPYLYGDDGNFAPRPAIVSAPTTANVGDVLAVTTDTSDIVRVTMVKTGAVTHSFNMDQRFLELNFDASGNSISVNLPTRTSDTPPGYYQLFVFNSDGVPSAARMVLINIDPTPNVAVDYTPTIGGGGGSPFKLECASDQALVGIHGVADTYVNQIGPQCVAVDQLGRWIGNPTYGPLTGTTTSGTSFDKACPRDYAVSGFRGRAGQYVNQLDFECRALTPQGGLTGTGQFLGADGGGGGSQQALQRCGTGNPVYALYGRSGGWLDNFGVQCRQAPITQISINSIPVVANPGNQIGNLGVATSLQIVATDGDDDPLNYAAIGLPDGLAIDAGTGLISGTPTSAGLLNVTVTVDDTIESDQTSFEWEILNVIPLEVDPMPAQPPVLAGATVNYTAVARHGSNPVFKWNFGDGTPETLYSSSDSIAHVFSDPGIYFVTLSVTDDIGPPQIQTFVQAVHLPLTAPSMHSSQIVYEESAGNDRIWVVNQDNASVTVFDSVLLQKIVEIPVGDKPRSMAIAPDGRVWVTNLASSSISVINSGTLTVDQTIQLPSGSEPYGIVFSQGNAYVVLQALGEVHRYNSVSGTQSGALGVGAHPRHITASGDGSKLYVSRFVTPPQPGEDTGTVSGDIGGIPTGGEVLVLDTASLAITNTIVLEHSQKPDAENQGRGVPNYLGAAVISPDGESAWVPSKMDNILRGSLRDGSNLNFQNTVRAITSRIELSTESEDSVSRIDLDNASLSSAASFGPSGNYLYIALETSREVVVVDAYGKFELFRVDVGRAPQAILSSPDGARLYVSNFMDRSLTVLDTTELRDLGQWNIPTIAVLDAVDTEALTAQVLNGKQLFYDARDTRLARDAYMSSASCHNDGGHDGRVWDLTGMDEGLRNTIRLNGPAAGHGPLHWTANFDEVQDFEGQIRALAGGTGLMSDALFFESDRQEPLGLAKAGLSADLDALAAYVASLDEFPVSPYRDAGAVLTPDGQSGKDIFAREGCGLCHSGTAFSNSGSGTLHDVGTIKPASGQRLGQPLTGFDAPTLRGLWRTAPYLHDGSAATIEEAIIAHNGVNLNAQDAQHLAAYLLQIDSQEVSAPEPIAPAEIIVDNLDSNTSSTGTWRSSSGPNPWDGNSVYANGTVRFTWQPELPASGLYEAYAWWTYHGNRSTTVPYRIQHNGGEDTVIVNQRDSSLGGQWVLLGTYAMTAGINGDVSVSGENGQASADAVRYVLVGSAAPDTAPPTAPTSLAASNVESTELTLHWGASTDDSGYITYQVFLDGDYSSAVATVDNLTTVVIVGLAESTDYTFEVGAVDLAGNASALSNVLDVTTAAAPTEVIVDNLDANTSQVGSWSTSSGPNPWSGNSVYAGRGASSFTWQPALATSGLYEVYAWWTYHSARSSTVPYRIQHDAGEATVFADQNDSSLGGQWVLLGTYAISAGINGDVTVFTENGQASADAVRWVLIGNSEPDLEAPTDPSDLSAVASGATSIDLSWTASTDNLAQIIYEVFADGDYSSAVGSTVNETDFTVTGLLPNTEYSFEVRAKDLSNNQSGLSNSAVATTEDAPLETIVDNLDAEASSVGSWSTSSGPNPWEGNSVYSRSASSVFTWETTITDSGSYEVYAWWTYHPNRSSSVPYQSSMTPVKLPFW